MHDELMFLLSAIGAGETDTVKTFNMQALCVLLYATGCRVSELLCMSGNQLQRLADGEDVRVAISKTNSTRVLFLTNAHQALLAQTLPAFREQLDTIGLTNTQGKKLRYRLAEKWLNTYFRALEAHVGAAAHVFNTHSFRTGYVNRMLTVFSLPEVAHLVGHRSYSTTLAYARNTTNTAYFRRKLSTTDNDTIAS